MLEMTPRKQTPTPHGAPAVSDVDWVVRLDEPAAQIADRVGAKAAALARATNAGMPALPGFVISTEGTAALTDDDKRQQALCILLKAWTASAGVERALVVRSSSTIEDGASSSMAGRFESVLDVTGWDAFVEAVDDVIDSAILEDGNAAPMAVLVQPMLRPRLGGVLFGADPMTGRTDRLLLTAVEGGPHQLVSGEVDGIQLGLTTAGKRVGKGDSLPGLGKAQFAALAALARRAAEVFGGPQDIEWAIDGDAVVLLQSRPITTLEPPAVGVGPVLGPGPVAETLPGTVAALEASLWVTPLRDAIEAALQLTAAASRRTIERSPIVTIVDGQVVADLELLGVHRKRGFFRKLDPRPGARRLSASWRVGRLQASLPSLADDLVHSTDEALLDVSPLAELTDGELVAVLRAAPAHLVNLHTFEVLAGMLAPSKATGGPTGAMAALHALADGRRRGLSDDEIVAGMPVVLSLLPPRVGPAPALPSLPTSLPNVPESGHPVLEAREALRLRARWVQELTARVAWELGERLAAAGRLPSPAAVRGLTVDELDAVVAGATAADRELADDAPVAALPARFRLSVDGDVVPVATKDRGDGARGAGGGRGAGPVHHGDDPPVGAVLVVRTLSPELAPLLPRLHGLVAESGSVLSHLAILARESGVPVVVGLHDAVNQFAVGTIVSVDGGTGDVSVLEAAPVTQGGES